ncbi:uncharacterized protein LOC143599611 [Bidens hawaiensis]|uniref:uncharacterized protein LOC143599611 n=1 Tax=Bidens hawaiensis TaxID=980011 RepID=UPI00404B1E31
MQEERPPWTHQFENLSMEINSGTKPSLECPPKVELKELPSHLKYAFLEDNETLLIIIASNLEEDQEKAFVKVLGVHKAAIGWTFADLKDKLGVELGKSHFMVQEGIVLGHVVSSTGMEVDQAKIKDVTFEFTDECLQAFDSLNEKLVEAPIL